MCSSARGRRRTAAWRRSSRTSGSRPRRPRRRGWWWGCPMACRGPPAPGGEGLGEVGPEGDRQPTGRVHGAGEHLGDRLAAGLPGVPGLDDRLDLVAPGHRRRVGSSEHHDRVRVGARYGVDDGVLSPRQRRPAPAALLLQCLDRRRPKRYWLRSPPRIPTPPTGTTAASPPTGFT
jgi:hypothetical protein